MTIIKSTLALALLVVFFVLPAQAQYTRVSPEPSNTWSTFIGQQMAQALESPSPDIRTKALEQIIALARLSEGALDLTDTVPALLSIYNQDSDERCRLAAVAALHALGDEEGMQRVRQDIDRQPSERVQLVSLAVLSDFYGPETFDANMARLTQAVLAYYQQERLTPPLIAVRN